ncbi:DNA sulfur modification protein DndB [Massilia sp. CCM 8734]|uniref:DNA sulfur modification protein DndB n=1 Tax=Massilia sp. CCM 8734 TaxID=2609283 RepID=UPI00142254C5|nr:DNA sulfur modification protein DndB [Massilia sp. CCM 8734]NIA00761.1 hypothetical protein [Massilia sp. CCM 8734]
MAIITKSKSALDVHVPGTIGTFRVSSKNGESAGIEVRYLLAHVTLSEKQGQQQLLSMLAPVREVFDLTQLGFEEIMQRDIDDARVSLELIPYLLDTSTSGQIKLFPPIVAVAMPLKGTSRAPDAHYRKVSRTEIESEDHPGITEKRITAGALSEEQFEFLQLFDGETALADGAQLSMSSHNCSLAIVDGQHRAMALLALFRNLTDGWSDSKRSPYESYYKVWPEKEIRSYDLNQLQLPILICTFPQLDKDFGDDADVIRAARKVFLTLNKTAKRVSDSRNKLLNDQDIVAECLRETLSFIKELGPKDNTGLRIFNVELDQEGDRVKIASDAAFTGVSHLYHMIEHVLMSPMPVRGVETKSKQGPPRKRLEFAFERLSLKDTLTQDQKSVNTRVNYSDEMAILFKDNWRELYVPIIDRIYGQLHPYASFSKATLEMQQELEEKRDTVLEKMLFDGQATSRTFDEFQEGLNRRVSDNEPNWTTPEIRATLTRVNTTLAARRCMVESMKVNRALFLLEGMSSVSRKKVVADDVIVKPIKDAIDHIYENVFMTVAFQTAVVVTFIEAINETSKDAKIDQPAALEEYISALNKLLKPENITGLKALLHTFEGELADEPSFKIVPGAPTFRQVVLPGELQPAEWPKYRYLILELWEPSSPSLRTFVETDRLNGRSFVARSLYKRRLAKYCEENRLNESDILKEVQADIQSKSKEMFEAFLSVATKSKVSLKDVLFEQSAIGLVIADPDDGLFAEEK